MGCQKAIAQKVIEKKGDYLLAVKENQKGLMKRLKIYLGEVPHEKKINCPKASTPKKKKMSTVEMNPDAVGLFI